MHIERNICDSLVKLLFGAKYTAASRRDMEEERIRQHLWVRRGPVPGGNYIKPPAPYVLTKEEQKKISRAIGRNITTDRLLWANAEAHTP